MIFRALMTLFIFISFCGLVHADKQLIELGRESNSVPAQNKIGVYLDRLRKSARTGYRGNTQPQPSVKSVVRELATSPRYPINTKLQLSGVSTIFTPNNYLGKPVCLLGSDHLSKDWLRQNAVMLQQYNIPCIVIEAQSESDLMSIKRIGQGVSIVALPMDQPLQQVGVNTYPILVINNNHPLAKAR